MLALSMITAYCVAANSPSQIMSRAMLAMMDTMGDLAHQFKRGDSWEKDWNGFNSYPPWSVAGYPDGYYPGAAPIRPHPPYRAIPQGTQLRTAVDGIWIGQGGEIVLVMYGYFRIYATAEVYRDGRYRLDGEWLLMHDPASGRTQEYQYVLNSGRMIMRSADGTLLRFKQLPIPIPPYALLPDPDPRYRY
jgi:hypothetical protein